ncbi:MAG: site-2 protease family protein [Planctomycetota bacterium]
MKSPWSLEVGRLAGIPIRIHATFLLLVAWVAFVHYRADPRLTSVALAVAFLLVVFALIVLHELSHALMARAFGVGTRDITLWPIGGVSSLERMPELPHQELLIALAGPVLNLVIALGLGIGVAVAEGAGALLAPDFSSTGLAFAAALFWVNVILAVFNLLPAFPMDGGRALRALLSMWLDRVQATRLAALAGKSMAVMFGLAGLLWNPILVLIAVFVWIGAGAEAADAELKAALTPHTVEHAASPAPVVLTTGEPLWRAAQLYVQDVQRVFPVVEGREVVGVLGELELLRGLARAGGAGRVGEHMSRDVVWVDRRAPLLPAFERLRRAGAACALVAGGDGDGRLVGVLTHRGIGGLLAVAAALRGELPPTSPDRLPLDEAPLVEEVEERGGDGEEQPVGAGTGQGGRA